MKIHVLCIMIIVMLCALWSFDTVAANVHNLDKYDNIPLAFTLNQGRLDSKVRFSARGNGNIIYFCTSETTFLLHRKTDKTAEIKKPIRSSIEKSNPLKETECEHKLEQLALKLQFINANTTTDIVGEEPLSWNTNFMGSDPDNFYTDVPNYKKIRLQDLYDGIDLVYYGNNKRIKYDFIIDPGVDPSQILLSYDAGDSETSILSVNDNGELVVSTPLGNIIEGKPFCYQIIEGKKVEVAVHYKILQQTGNQFTFELGNYDTRKVLIIDPEIIYSSFLGGTQDDLVYDMAVDSSGNQYVVGNTVSSGFPTTPGAYDVLPDNDSENIVTKMSGDGSMLEFSTFLGVTGLNYIDVDPNRNIYLAGTVYSPSFPTTAGSYDVSYNGNDDVVIMKVNSSGSALIYATYIGGLNSDECLALRVDDFGSVYVAGKTISPDFPTTAGAFDESIYPGFYDIFVTKLNTAGNALVYSTLIGGDDNDNPESMFIDGSGNVYITGVTGSSTFPTTPGAYDVSYNGSSDAFVTKLDATGSSLIYSTFLGDELIDCGYDIAVDNLGYAYITGLTNSTRFPKTTGVYHGNSDIFLTKLSVSGNDLVYSTLLGTTADEHGTGIAIDSSWNAIIIGETNSTDYPVTPNALDSMFNYTPEGFITKINVSGDGIEYSSYLSGVKAVVADIKDNVYVAGNAQHFNYYPATQGAFDESHNGRADIYVTKLSLAPSLIITSPNGAEEWIAGTSQNILWESDNVIDITIEFSLNNGQNWTTIASGVSASAGSYSWGVPGTLSTSCIIRVTDTVNAIVSDVSDDLFSIIPTPAPEINVSTPTVNIGEVDVGETVSQQFSIINEGYAVLTINSVISNSDLFTVSASSFSLEPGKGKTINVSFSPVEIGLRDALITVSNNDEDEGITQVVVNGNGVAPDIEISPDSLAIKYISLGSSADTVFVITNNGNKQLDISEIVSNNGLFSVDPVTLILQPSESDTVKVTYTPDEVGIHSAILTVTSNDGTHKVNIVGKTDVPEITTTSLPDAIEDAAYSTVILVDIHGSDIDYKFELGGGPGWLTIDNDTGMISGIPENSDVGNNILIIVRLTGSGQILDEALFTLIVSNVNDPPVIVSTTIEDAVIGELYTETLETTDPDRGDSTAISIIAGPQWLSVNDSGSLTGVPTLDDTGLNKLLVIGATDRSGLADTLITSINVLNYNVTPVILTKKIADAKVGIGYSDTIKVEYHETGGDLTFELINNPEWITINDEGILQGTPSSNDIGNDIPLTVKVVNQNGLNDIFSFVLIVGDTFSNKPYIAFDLDFQNSGYQGSGKIIDNPGPGELIGFAVYLKNNVLTRGFTISLTWDESKASIKKSDSIPNISDEIYNINGVSDVEFAEESNLLIADGTGYLFSVVGDDEPGRYEISFAKIGGESATQPEGLIYLVIFKTAPDLSLSDWFIISVEVTLADNLGNESPLEGKEITIGSIISPPSHVTVTDVPGDHGNSLEITWTLSPDDDSITHYNVYRSRTGTFTEPVARDVFDSLNELLSFEETGTIFRDFVPRGQSSYIDTVIPFAGTNYYYWLQAVGADGASGKVAADYITSVESMPEEFIISRPYPNPFNPSTLIRYETLENCHVKLVIYDILGREIVVLKDGVVSSGVHETQWNGRDYNGELVASGVYIYRLNAGTGRAQGKVLFLR